MFLKTQLESIGRAIILERFRDPLRSYLLKAGYDDVPYHIYAIFFILTLIATAVVHLVFLIPQVRAINSILGKFAVTFLFWILLVSILVTVVMFFIWTFLNLRIYNRTKEMEEKLPDYLALVVTNLKSGMSFDKSLWGAIRPEFGVLAREITMVSKKVLTGNDTSEALQEFADRYDSPILRRSINLIISEIESGGEVASVIQRVILNLRKTSQLKKEMAASVISYMIFISIIVLVLAPILFALANTILGVIISFAERIAAAPGATNLGGSASAMFESLSRLAETGTDVQGYFNTFSYAALVVLSLFAGMIVSILEKGDIKGGVKYIPVFITVSVVIFLFVSAALRSLFSTFV